MELSTRRGALSAGLWDCELPVLRLSPSTLLGVGLNVAFPPRKDCGALAPFPVSIPRCPETPLDVLPSSTIALEICSGIMFDSDGCVLNWPPVGKPR